MSRWLQNCKSYWKYFHVLTFHQNNYWFNFKADFIRLNDLLWYSKCWIISRRQRIYGLSNVRLIKHIKQTIIFVSLDDRPSFVTGSFDGCRIKGSMYHDKSGDQLFCHSLTSLCLVWCHKYQKTDELLWRKDSIFFEIWTPSGRLLCTKLDTRATLVGDLRHLERA